VPSAKPAAAAERKRMRITAEFRSKMVASEGEKSLNPEYHGELSAQDTKTSSRGFVSLGAGACARLNQSHPDR
jgi:hypothetical protein